MYQGIFCFSLAYKQVWGVETPVEGSGCDWATGVCLSVCWSVCVLAACATPPAGRQPLITEGWYIALQARELSALPLALNCGQSCLRPSSVHRPLSHSRVSLATYLGHERPPHALPLSLRRRHVLSISPPWPYMSSARPFQLTTTPLLCK